MCQLMAGVYFHGVRTPQGEQAFERAQAAAKQAAQMKATIVLGIGLGWALFVSLPAHAGLESFAVSVAAALAPYAVLAAVSGRLRPGVHVGAVVIVLSARTSRR